MSTKLTAREHLGMTVFATLASGLQVRAVLCRVTDDEVFVTATEGHEGGIYKLPRESVSLAVTCENCAGRGSVPEE